MQSFTEQLKASALKAAIVAQALATNGLDEMAASDEYVQSEGYNATTRTKTSSASNNPDPIITQNHQRAVIYHSNSTSNHAAMENTPKVTPLHMFPTVNERENDDPEQHVIDPNKLQHINNDKATKSRPNRFMEDLECRMSIPLEQQQEYNTNHIQTSTANENKNDMKNDTIILPSWLSNTASSMGIPTPSIIKTMLQQPQQSKTEQMMMAPLSRNKIRRGEDDNNNIYGHNVELVSSTTMLGKEEMEELEKFRLLENQSSLSPFSVLVHMLYEYRREATIGITLIVFAFVYYYSSII